MLRNFHFSYIVQNRLGIVMFTYSIYIYTSTTADARHQEENPMRKKCLKAVVQEGHNICSREWQMLSVYRQIKILV